MFDQMSKEFFDPHMNSNFIVTGQGIAPVHMKLVNAEEKKDEKNYSLSLIFLETTGHYLPQKIYQFEHEKLGKFDMFIVPIGESEKGISFQAIVSRLIKKSE